MIAQLTPTERRSALLLAVCLALLGLVMAAAFFARQFTQQ